MTAADATTQVTRALRAFVFAMPLSILVGVAVAPPDALEQLVVIVVALVVGWPLTDRVVDVRSLTPLAIGGFYLVVLAVVAVGFVAIASADVAGGGATVAARVAVVGLALLVADRVVLARGIG